MPVQPTLADQPPAQGDKPLDHTERIVRGITRAIADRKLLPGTKLTEQKIADIFQVSRTLVRQALNQLSRDHLVTLSPSRGAFVATPTVEEARDVFDVRIALESIIMQRLSSQITRQQISQLRQHLALERSALKCADISARTRLLGEFHLLLARMLDNQVLLEILTDLLNRSSLIALMYQSQPSAKHSQSEHEDIVDALERRDATTAIKLITDHLNHLEQSLRIDAKPSNLAQVLLATDPAESHPQRQMT